MSTCNQFIENMHRLPFEGGLARDDDANWAAAVLTKIQREHKVYGGVGEIGVHVGTYFVALALTARIGEPLFALDIFENQQHKNIDSSGNGNLYLFLHNVNVLGISQDQLVIHEGSSTEITPQQFCEKVQTGFRFFSIDGGHTKDIVLNDLVFAECCLMDGGIVSLDDYTNVYWPGVQEGLSAYFDRYGNQSRLAPFFIHANKLYLTTTSHHDQYLTAISAMRFWDDACESDVYVQDEKRICIEGPGVNTGNPFKFQLGGHTIAVAEFRKFNQAKMKQVWRDSLQAC